MTAHHNRGVPYLSNMSVQIAIIVASLQLVASQTPLPLPANPAVDCGLDVTRQWSRDYPQCMQSVLGNSIIYNSPAVDPGRQITSSGHCGSKHKCPLTLSISSTIKITPLKSLAYLLDADEQCCAGTQKYFGSESTLPSRNCFCDPDVYARFMSGTASVDVVTAFGIC